jgi:hypothetical protein
METSFLMSTILRIGSLMQVGFGSAGTEIIRSGLERGRHKGEAFAYMDQYAQKSGNLTFV